MHAGVIGAVILMGMAFLQGFGALCTGGLFGALLILDPTYGAVSAFLQGGLFWATGLVLALVLGFANTCVGVGLLLRSNWGRVGCLLLGLLYLPTWFAPAGIALLFVAASVQVPVVEQTAHDG